jgi:hypothetical protein
MERKILSNLKPYLYYLFFINGLIEVVAEYFQFLPIIYITKPLIPLILLVMFWLETKSLPILFFWVYITSSLTNILFIPEDETILFYGVIIFTIHRLLLLYLIKKSIGSLNWYIVTSIAVLLFAIFYYLFLETSEVPNNSYVLLIFHVFLVSILGSISITNYIKKDTIMSAYLLIAGLLFISLQLVIYIEKYFLHSINIVPLRPIAMLLNVLAFFSFYKFILENYKVKQQ